MADNLKRKLRNGFTTGSCAAAAAKAAAYMLLTGSVKSNISIITPKGVAFDAEILDVQMSDGHVRCAVRKDGGDDPDVTTGALIYADVSFSNAGETGEAAAIKAAAGIDGSIGEANTIISAADGIDCNGDGGAEICMPAVRIDGGEGVGRVTRPGLDQPVGAAAINSVPRAMIMRETSEVMDLCDYHGGLDVVISVPGGAEIAEKTFNPRLGIEGGISIIGTSGIVEPMSEQAILDTIRVELQQHRAEGERVAFISPGNYGAGFMRETYGIDLDRSIKCSNFIGRTVDMAAELGFEAMLLAGHAGKLVKVAGGIMNTHSREADCRMEIIASAAAREGADTDLILGILDSLTTEEAFAKLELRTVNGQHVSGAAVSAGLMDSIMFHLNRRAGGGIRIECLMYTNEQGLLAASAGAEDLIRSNTEIWSARQIPIASGRRQNMPE